MKNNFIHKLIIFLLSIFLLENIFAQNPGEINLVSECDKYGIDLYWDPLTQSGILEKRGHQISFHIDEDFSLYDYKKITFEKAPYLRNEVLFSSKGFFDKAIQLFNTDSEQSLYKIGAILIDPGHGGKDPGASATHTINGKTFTVKEKDVNLSVGLKLYDYLKKACPDKKILMTRNTDVFISLQQRTEIANSVKLKDNEAILYVSIHVNASLDKKASGYEVWYLSPGYRRQVLKNDKNEDKAVQNILNSMLEEEYTTESILIAKFITDGIQAQVSGLSSSRGIKAEEWFVVRNANMPSVLIETGFLTNPKEGALLADDKYLQKISFGIYNGLQAFISHFERSHGFTGVK